MQILLGLLGIILAIALVIWIISLALKLLGFIFTLVGIVLPIVGLFLLTRGRFDKELEKLSSNKFKVNRKHGFIIIIIVSIISYQIGNGISGLFDDEESTQVVSEIESEEKNDKENSEYSLVEKEEDNQSTLVETQEDKNKEEKIEEVDNIIETTDAEIHFINTGNSDSILVKQGDKSALIDGGENGDENTVVSYLKSQGVTELEYVFATHPDADHIGGLDAVINSISVKNVFVSNGDASTNTYTDFINAIANRGLSPSVPLLDSEFKLGSSIFKVVSVANTNEPNNNSLVLLYTNGNDKILFTGDAGQEIENKLNVDDIDLLKVGHHGSKTSTSSSFIEKIKPEYAVILVGENNKYKHPNSEVMNILENNNIEVHRTDECGNIVFKSSGNGLTVDCKEGSYKSGDNSSSSNNSSSSSSNSSYANTSNSSNVDVQQTPTTSVGGTVYWTPNGKSYHTTDGCSTLSRSKTILSGTQAQSGKSDPCDRCH
ncbi:ComEC family competence protein [uncultured Clostridium sp.]|nr:ComEC family competence protein [uncultured Clostridium sp.]